MSDTARSNGLPAGLLDLLGGGLAEVVGSTRRGLAETVVTGTAGGGAVTVTLSGDGRLTSLEIAPETFDQADRETLQDLIVAAAGEAFREVSAAKTGALSGALRGFGLET